jgi:hypothetical protein
VNLAENTAPRIKYIAEFLSRLVQSPFGGQCNCEIVPGGEGARMLRAARAAAQGENSSKFFLGLGESLVRQPPFGL